jgi:hypothetical protein
VEIRKHIKETTSVIGKMLADRKCSRKKIIATTIVFLLPMGPLMILAYVLVCQFLEKLNADKKREDHLPAQPT